MKHKAPWPWNANMSTMNTPVNHLAETEYGKHELTNNLTFHSDTWKLINNFKQKAQKIPVN